MNLMLYNTYSKKKEKFSPLEKGKVKMYACGPTVYDYAHIGNFWSYLTADILRRYLEYLNYEVLLIKNITDVGHFTDDDEPLDSNGEDKMEKAAKRDKKDPIEIADYYTQYYEKDEKKLNIKKPHFQPRPTREIDQIIKIIQELINKGFAYETEDGVYFSVQKFQKYGKLSGNPLDKIKKGARIEINENKKDPADFALWKKKVGKNRRHSLHWQSPWGKGFPGWHIECTAMAIKYLGDSIDIHTGGEDNIFPHHEAEIAQSEAYTQKPFVKYWIHTRHFYIEGKKMSKSLQNVYTISKTPDKRYQSLEEMGYHPLIFRTLKLQSHYRSKANFTFQAMDQAAKNLKNINHTYQVVKTSKFKKNQKNSIKINCDKVIQEFNQAMNNDLNCPLAFSALLKFVKNINKKLTTQKNLSNQKEILKTIEKMDSVFAILKKNQKKKTKIPKEINELAQTRLNARKKKDFSLADKIRKKVEEKGYEIIDNQNTYQIKKK
ncbi:MAG: cysteine--tRNA ligase [Candidatus Moranbacteria bacterium]|nr:cysteine--tRNA ligase [Candidatus Moranbacteria bacterium]